MTITMTEHVPAVSINDTVKRYGKQLLGFIRSKVPSLQDAEDIMQEVWYQLSRLGNADQLESVSGWLYRVSRNKITDLYRKRSTESLDDFIATDDEEMLAIKDILLLDDGGDPELTLFKNLFWQELMHSLQELPEKQRRVFVLHELEGKTLQEIADQDNEHIKTIISRKGYAIKHLRKKLDYLYRELYT